jgi:fumarylacetoacetase
MLSHGIDETHDPARRSWVESANGHADFPIQNLPFGIFSTAGAVPRPGLAIGDMILDLQAVASAGLLPDPAVSALSGQTLNALMALPADDRRVLRQRLSDLLCNQAWRAAVASHLHAPDACAMHLPATIGDYTDFYAGLHHAENVGRLFRPDKPLLPNYKHVPIGYHGRASSVRPSGTQVIRPHGQRRHSGQDLPSFGPCERLDYELELGIWIGSGNPLGTPIPIAEAANHIAGLCLLNDWSARDIQAWEYQPLGPFLAKSFATSISPWVITAEALAPFRIPPPPRPAADPRPLTYLWDEADQAHGAYSIDLQVTLTTRVMRDAGLAPHRLSQGPASNLYWTCAQIVAHHTSNGCNLNPGDLIGTGTISTPTEGGYGSLLEITAGGAQSLTLASGETRLFLEDGDEITLAATAHAPGFVSIGFGHCSGKISKANFWS